MLSKMQKDMIRAIVRDYIKAGSKDKKSTLRNKILNILSNLDIDAYEIRFTIDILTKDNRNKNVRVAGIKNNSLYIKVDDILIPLGHAWLRSDMIPEVLDYRRSDIDKEHKLNVKIKTYEWTDSKFEFTTI
jgi:hypothetical protein